MHYDRGLREGPFYILIWPRMFEALLAESPLEGFHCRSLIPCCTVMVTTGGNRNGRVAAQRKAKAETSWLVMEIGSRRTPHSKETTHRHRYVHSLRYCI